MELEHKSTFLKVVVAQSQRLGCGCNKPLRQSSGFGAAMACVYGAQN